MKEDFKCRKYFLQTLEKVLIYTHQCKIDLTMHTINANCKYFLQQLASFSVLIISLQLRNDATNLICPLL